MANYLIAALKVVFGDVIHQSDPAKLVNGNDPFSHGLQYGLTTVKSIGNFAWLHPQQSPLDVLR
ncbi:MAG: hypothetical protein DDT39_00288 [Firmicutes bacterium]|nr:hypothetical protein [candidate division NPL-UPA2 bacterium]